MEPKIALRGVTKRFRRTSVLDGLDLTVFPGDTYGFLGRNGSGKSTTLRVAMGILRSDAGHLELFGRRVRQPRRADKERIGYVAQEPHFYPWMSAEDLGRFVRSFFPRWSVERFQALTRRFEVPGRVRVAEMSGGTRAKLALALALAHEPELLLLDEPTSGLDPVARHEFLEILDSEGALGERSTVFSSHLVDDVERLANRIGILDAGRMIYEGPPVDLLAELRLTTKSSSPRPPGVSVVQPNFRGRALVRAPAGHWAEPSGVPLEAVTLEQAFVGLCSKTSRP